LGKVGPLQAPKVNKKIGRYFKNFIKSYFIK